MATTLRQLLLAHQPSALWVAEEITVRGGTSWVTFDCTQRRLSWRGAGELQALARLLSGERHSSWQPFWAGSEALWRGGQLLVRLEREALPLSIHPYVMLDLVIWLTNLLGDDRPVAPLRDVFGLPVLAGGRSGAAAGLLRIAAGSDIPELRLAAGTLEFRRRRDGGFGVSGGRFEIVSCSTLVALGLALLLDAPS